MLFRNCKGPVFFNEFELTLQFTAASGSVHICGVILFHRISPRVLKNRLKSRLTVSSTDTKYSLLKAILRKRGNWYFLYLLMYCLLGLFM